MRSVIFSFMFILTTLNLFSQTNASNGNYESRYGIKFSKGLIINRPEISVIGNENGIAIYDLSTTNTVNQSSYGLFAQKKFGFLYAEASLMYSTYGIIYNVNSYSGRDNTNHSMTEKFGYTNLQVMSGITTHGIRIGVGPVMHIMSNHSSDLNKLENYSEKTRNISYGFSGAIGYNIGMFSLDLKYDKAFRTIGDHMYYNNKKSQFHSTPDALTFCVGIALVK